MDMQMLMAMYGINDKFSIMGMVHYLSYDMDMVMHMFTPAGGVRRGYDRNHGYRRGG